MLLLFIANKALKAMSLLVSTFFSASKLESFYNMSLMLTVLSLKREGQKQTEMELSLERENCDCLSSFFTSVLGSFSLDD